MATLEELLFNPLWYSLAIVYFAWRCERKRERREGVRSQLRNGLNAVAKPQAVVATTPSTEVESFRAPQLVTTPSAQVDSHRSPEVTTRSRAVSSAPCLPFALTPMEQDTLTRAGQLVSTASTQQFDYWVFDEIGHGYPVEQLFLERRGSVHAIRWLELPAPLEKQVSVLLVPLQGILRGCAIKNTARISLRRRRQVGPRSWGFNCTLLACHPESDDSLFSPVLRWPLPIQSARQDEPQPVGPVLNSDLRHHPPPWTSADPSIYLVSDSGEVFPVVSYTLRGISTDVTSGRLVTQSASLEGTSGVLIYPEHLNRSHVASFGRRIRVLKLLATKDGESRYSFIGQMAGPVALDLEAFKASLQGSDVQSLPQVCFDQEGGFRLDSPKPRLVLVRQRGRHDCGVAAVATIAEVPYEAVLDRTVTGLSAASGLTETAMWRTLQDVTQADWRTQELEKPWPTVAAYQLSDVPIVVIIHRANGSRHYVVVGDGWVYDPQLRKPVAQAEYRDRDSLVATIFCRCQERQSSHAR